MFDEITGLKVLIDGCENDFFTFMHMVFKTFKNPA